MESLPYVSIVVIGRNESRNLVATFSAINIINYPNEKIEIIYVDTNSVDNSVEIAKKYTNQVFIENNKIPSPGLARNRGIIEAKFDIIHFIDGDIQIDPDYLIHAIRKISENNIHAVYGYLDESSDLGINKILLSHWKDKKEGFSDATGGGGTYLKKKLIEVNGYDERILKGQETELGERFRNSGGNIYFLQTRMGTHNYDVHTFVEYLKPVFRDGESKAMTYLIKGVGIFFKENNHRFINLIIQNIVLYSLVILSIILDNILILFSFLILYILYILYKYLIIEKINDPEKIIYFLLIIFSKPICFAGAITTLFKYKIYRKKFPSKMRINKSIAYHS